MGESGSWTVGNILVMHRYIEENVSLLLCVVCCLAGGLHKDELRTLSSLVVALLWHSSKVNALMLKWAEQSQSLRWARILLVGNIRNVLMKLVWLESANTHYCTFASSYLPLLNHTFSFPGSEPSMGSHELRTGVCKVRPTDQIQPTTCFCLAHELKKFCYIFKWLGKK